MTLNMPKLGLTSFLSLSRTQKTVGPKILEIWDTLMITLPQKFHEAGKLKVTDDSYQSFSKWSNYSEGVDVNSKEISKTLRL